MKINNVRKKFILLVSLTPIRNKYSRHYLTAQEVNLYYLIINFYQLKPALILSQELKQQILIERWALTSGPALLNWVKIIISIENIIHF